MKEKDYRLDTLFAQVLTYRNSEQFRSFMRHIAGLTKLSPYNAMLVGMQRPGAKRVATADQWHAKKAEIKEGANPLIILKPFGPVEFVFEEGDIVENTLPPEIRDSPFHVRSGTVPLDGSMRLMKNLRRCGINVNMVAKGRSLAGYTTVNRSGMTMNCTCGNYFYTIEWLHDIVINTQLSEVEQFATLLHEVAHIYCGHLGNWGNEKLPWEDRRGLSQNTEEFEAECVAWIVCQRHEIDNPSEEYLAGYLDNNETIPEGISVERVLCAAGRIESQMEDLLPPLAAVVKSKVKFE